MTLRARSASLAIDVDEWPAAAERFGVRGLPTLIFFRDGVELHRTTGVSTYDDLKRQTARLLARERENGASRERSQRALFPVPRSRFP